MSDNNSEGVRTRNMSASQGPAARPLLSLDDVTKKPKETAGSKKTPAEQGGMGKGKEGGESETTISRSGKIPITLRRQMWNEVFHGDNCVLLDTEFMKHLQDFLSSEQANLMLNWTPHRQPKHTYWHCSLGF